MFKVSFVPDYQNCGIKEFESKEDAERFVQRARADLVSEWLKVNAGKNAEEYFDDPHTVDVEIIESAEDRSVTPGGNMKYVLEEMTQEIWGTVYGTLVERLLQDHGAVEILEDEYGCIVDVRPYKEPVKLSHSWGRSDEIL